MARPKGSKNIPKDQEVVDTDQITIDPILVSEDLVQEKPKKKVLIGYHPISGAEVWQ
jgi:hypothetical protein